MIIKCSLAVVKHRLVRAARWVKISFAFCVSCGHRSVGRAGECLFLHLFQRSGERCSGCKSKLLYLDIEASERKPFIITSCFVADGKMLIRISDRCIMTENYTGSSCCTRSPYGLFFCIHESDLKKSILLLHHHFYSILARLHHRGVAVYGYRSRTKLVRKGGTTSESDGIQGRGRKKVKRTKGQTRHKTVAEVPHCPRHTVRASSTARRAKPCENKKEKLKINIKFY